MDDAPLRILQVMRAPVGGLFRHAADLTRALSAMGHSVGLVVDNLANDAQTETRLKALEPHAVLGIHRFDMPRLFGKGDVTTPFAVRKLARRLKVDIIHGHGAKGGFYARLALFGGGRAMAFYTPHGGVLHYPTSSLSGRLFHRLERVLMAQTSAILFESDYARRTYTALIGPTTCPTQVIHNGVAPDEFVPVPPTDDAADFVFVGELRTLKGIFPMVDALAAVKRPDGSRPNLVMAGDGPDRDALVARISALGLEDNIRMIGSRPAREVFAMGRCALVPSLAESLPYVVLEAAAAQLPVIATNVGGIPEIFAGSQQSLVPPDDASALAEAMRNALADPDSLQAEMQQRLGRVREEFSVERMAGAIEANYRQARKPR